MKIDIWVLLKGMLMGAADIVPGVSGGTIAFITGIYERLINAIKNFLPSVFALFKHRNVKVFWGQCDGAFLITLLSGIIIAVISLAKLITFLLVAHPILIWSFFFGLIVASVVIVSKQIKDWSVAVLLSLIAGAASAWLITGALPGQIEETLPNAFISGAIAICAMILPGISGSFILLVLGSYGFILSALKSFDMAVLLVFVSGCVVGILTIANILSWALTRIRAVTLAILTGFMIGALNKVWPWKQVLSYRLNRHGEQVPLEEMNIMPAQYELLTGLSSQLVPSIVLMLSAVFFVLLLERCTRESVS